MGWKTSTIVIKPAINIDVEDLLDSLGYKGANKSGSEPYEIAMNPYDDTLYVGRYKDCLLICSDYLPMLFFGEDLVSEEQIFIQKFPGAEICSFALHSVTNLWGYAVIQNGKKIRVRAGTADEGVMIDIGEPLEEEKELLATATVDKNGIRTYPSIHFPGERLTEDQVGEDFVFEISRRYFGNRLDQCDELLFETMLEGYASPEEASSPTAPISDVSEETQTPKKPWWKFW